MYSFNKMRGVKSLLLGLLLIVFIITISINVNTQTSDYKSAKDKFNELFSKRFATAVECGSIPTDGCKVTQNTIFQRGVYNLPNGILVGSVFPDIADGIGLDCNLSRINGTLLQSSVGIMIGSSGPDVPGQTLKDCIISNYDVGIQSGTVNSLFNNNALLNNSRYGMEFIAHNNTISSNFLVKNGAGLNIIGPSNDNVIVDNFIVGNVLNGIKFVHDESNLGSFPRSTDVFNNTLVCNGGYGINIIGLGISTRLNSFYNNLSNFNQTNLTQRALYNRILNLLNDTKFCFNGRDALIVNNTLIDVSKTMSLQNEKSSILSNNILGYDNGIVILDNLHEVEVSNNFVCDSNNYDLSNSTIFSYNSFGVNNSCDSTNNWNDQGSAGCTLTCLGFKCGDANADLKVNLVDIIYLVNYVFKSGPEPLTNKLSGDVNKDNMVNLADIVYLVNYIFKGGSAPCE